VSAANLRPDLIAVLEACCKGRAPGSALSIDALGDAIGARSVSTQDLELLFDALEVRGIEVSAPRGLPLEACLGRVVMASAALQRSHGRRPTLAEVASHAELDETDVRHALALLRIMQR
jgi:hypothetical protein